MNEAVRAAALDLVARAEALGYYARIPASGEEPIPATASAEEVAVLQNDLGGRLPAWYIELLTTVPLCYLTFEYQSEDDATYFLYWNDPANLRSESLDLWPGQPILERGYICIVGVDGVGDSLFFSVEEGDDPPLYYIAHDSGADADTVLAGRENFAPSLSVLLRGATVTERDDSN